MKIELAPFSILVLLPVLVLSTMVARFWFHFPFQVFMGLLVFPTAFFWGMRNHRMPESVKKNQYFQVISGNFDGAFGKNLRVQSVTGESFLAYGDAKKGDWGTLDCKWNGFKRRCYWKSIVYLRSSSLNSLNEILIVFRRFIQNRVNRMDPYLAKWFKTLLLADFQAGVDYSTLDSFKKIGIFHLFIFSGFHVSSIFGLTSFIISFPIRLMKIMGRLKPEVQITYTQLQPLCSTIIIFIFISAIGFGPASIRGFLLFAVYENFSLLWGRNNKTRLILVAAFLQTLLFPLGFFSVATALSWGCFWVIKFTLGEYSSVGKKLVLSLMRQVFLTLFSGILIGDMVLLGVVCNILLLPFFPVIFYLLIFSLLTNSSILQFLSRSILEVWAGIVHWLNDYAIFERLDGSIQSRFFSSFCLIFFLALLHRLQERFLTEDTRGVRWNGGRLKRIGRR